jgi:hypothetical protein
MQELIDLTRLMKVLDDYGADEAELGSEPREALEQLRRLCPYLPGAKILLKKSARYNTWGKGVVIAFMLCKPKFVVGPGDDRVGDFEGKPLFAVDAKDLRPRNKPDKGSKIQPWPKKKEQENEN